VVVTQSSLFEPAAHDPECGVRVRLPASWTVSAEFDGPGDCYRTKLKHTWGPGPTLLWLMMNPSGADTRSLDMTVQKTGRIAQNLGFGSQFIGNACAYRATDRMRLLEVADPVGPTNHAAVLQMAAESAMIVVAHGKLPGQLQCHADRIVALLRSGGHQLHVLGLCGDVPIHPLARGKRHIPYSVTPTPW
jgi:hypothetical protein